MQIKTVFQTLSVIAVLFAGGSTFAVAKEQDVAAWIEFAYPQGALAPKNAHSRAQIVIFRQGQPLSLDKSAVMTELRSGDRVLVHDSKAYLTLLTSTGRLRVTADMSKDVGYELNARPNSIWDNLVDLVTDKFKLGQSRVVSASSRGVPWLEAEGAPTIPADQTQFSKLAAGERALHLRWQGGKPPYRLSLMRDNQILSKLNVPKGSEASLPKLPLLAGNYTLVIRDSKWLNKGDARRSSVVANLILLAPGDIPPMPQALAAALLPEEARQLLYADWLARQGEGEWSMEAIQIVAPYAKDYEPAQDWLRQWGGS